MKFDKRLRELIEEMLPEWRDKFLSYKKLKKKLNLMYPTGKANKQPRLADGVMEEERDFIQLLKTEIQKLNSFFMDKEEEYVIREKVLQDRAVNACDSYEEMIKHVKETIALHGEMVLLENYSALNYIGLVKILKKHDKRTGALIREPFIQGVLQEPFFTTDLLYKLVKDCETMLDRLFPAGEPLVYQGSAAINIQVSSTDGLVRLAPKDLAEIEYMESLYVSTLAALRVLKEIRSGSSTPSTFPNLPPL